MESEPMANINFAALRGLVEAERMKGAGWILLTPRLALRLLDEAERFERIAALTPESMKPRARGGNG
jgi:hypothetical protein